jgi:hypothetical protein
MDIPFPLALPVYMDIVVGGFLEPAPATLRDILEDAGCTLVLDATSLPQLIIEPTTDRASGLRIRMLVILTDPMMGVIGYGQRLSDALHQVLLPLTPFTLRLRSVRATLVLQPSLQFRV